jgi:hypothetical protein
MARPFQGIELRLMAAGQTVPSRQQRRFRQSAGVDR